MEFREGGVANETQYSPIGLILHPRVRILLSERALHRGDSHGGRSPTIFMVADRRLST
jgi:hypothetical protein